ncbi:MAG: hydrogenase formation protein HypD [Endomicrobiaceae bacterium]
MIKQKKAKFMEVCGTHTFAIAKFGIKSIYSETINFLSGPGCPVCVTSQEDIDYIIELAKNKNNIIVSFGDMIRVPSGNLKMSLEKLPQDNIKIIYSVGEVLNIAYNNSSKNVIFIAVGFETTSPLIASIVSEAKENKIKNFFIFAALKTIIPAIDFLLRSKQINVDGFILPGHVCSVTGYKPFEFIVKKYNIACTVAGFNHTNLKTAIDKLYEMHINKNYKLINCYTPVVSECGNITAQDIVNKVFEKDDAVWRGLGNIKESGLKLNKNYNMFNILNIFKKTDKKQISQNTCICGKLFTGKYKPTDCSNFAKKCTPVTPIGPCMVSSEGVCASYYKYGEENDK